MWRPQRSELGAKVGKSKQTSATKRLLQDLKVINESTIPTVGVVALPLEKDLFTWHCNVRGPKGTMYEGGVFHLILEFPKTYPHDPPTVTVCTTLQHPNVFGTTICLDMLQPGDEQERYMGWSSAYSVQSVLIQLQAFLFEESPTLRAEDARKAVEAANNFSCRSCKHKPLRSWPTFPSYEKESFQLDFDEVDLAKEELVCFHSKRNFKEDVLGFGISFTKNIRTGDVQDISTPLDLLGIKSFIRDGIRKSSINEPFTHWVPVYINDDHGKRAFHLAKKALSMICTGNTKEFKPEMALTVFPKLMNTMVVQIMKGQIHASIKALEGYCAFHQMFLAFLAEYPELRKACEERVEGFLKDAAQRHKDRTPSLGEFLPLLAVVPQVQWKDAAAAVVEESFDRQVQWTVKDYPDLGKEEEDPVVDKERISVTFGASIVGHRLLMFHMYFLEHVVKSLGASVKDMADKYAQLYGRPTVRMMEDMQQAFRDIKKVKTHNDFFARVGLPTLPDEELKVLLRKSVTNSKKKGYHGVEGPKVPSPEELIAESLKLVVPLKSLCVPVKGEGETSVLHDKEEEWQDLCKTRWGYVALPKEYTSLPAEYFTHPWKHLYLQTNLQDFVHSLKDRPDFPAFYETLQLSAPIIKQLEISISGSKKIKSGFHFLTALVSKLTNLERLSIRKGLEGGLGVKGVRALVKGLKNNGQSLRKLDLSFADIYGESTELLTEGLLTAPNLTSLSLQGNSMGHHGIKGLMPLLWSHKNVTELDLASCSIDSAGAKELADGLLANKKLRIVNLAKNPLGDAGLRAIIYNLAFSPSIEELDLSRVTSSYGDASVAEALAKLFKITVTLTKLNLWKTNIASSFNHETVKALAENRSITHLDLGQIGSLDGNQMAYFGTTFTVNKTLRIVNMERNNISGSSVERLYQALFIDKEEKEKQKQLKQKEKEEGDRERRRLEMLDKQKQVEKEFHFELLDLNLNNNSLSAGGKILGKVVHIAASLEVLCLEGCQLDASVGETLGLAMEENVSLRILKLKQNNLGKEGAKALAAGLERNDKLKLELLDLSGNNIGVSGARAFGRVLEKNHSITSFNLFGNLIDVDGARSIATALKVNTTLTNIDLGLNRIRDKGALQLAAALLDHPSLTELSVKLNFIKDQGALALARSVAKSRIGKFALAGNEFEDVTLMQIYEMMKSTGKEEGFDLGSRIAILDPERVARSIWVTPLTAKVNAQSVKKLFYDNHCGVVLNVSIHDHVTKTSPQKAKYAFVEFAHINSVSLALDLSSSGKAWIDRQSVRCYRVGSQTKEGAGKSAGRGQEIAQPPQRGERRGGRPTGGRDRPAGRGGGRGQQTQPSRGRGGFRRR